MIHRLSLTVCAVLGALLFATTANAGLLEPHLRFTSLPQCGDEKVLADIAKRFNAAEEETWQRGIYMEGITRVHERELLENEDRLINRRYCRARAILSNSRDRVLFYLIEEGQGFAGLKWEVFFCVNGLDPWRVYDGSCRVLNH